ncbi:MAG TPA: S-methyl-5-thioribose-1-phosphate isomerase [Polyangiaceae bacterium]|nr:S-methyl-5-thioribose-1-phosphate isomerase [Polyangiaceae bacterium]
MAALPHPEPLSGESYSAVELAPGDDEVILLDQRRLPGEEIYFRLTRVEQVADAIRDMVVRGAPAIGITAAYGLVIAAARAEALTALEAAAQLLRVTRPTAVNLAWALDRMLARARVTPPSELRAALAAEARAIHREDVAACRRMGALGAEHVPDGATILTHCNAGALATGGYGTALGVIRAARDAGKRVRVLADETRPYLQGARLTAWELHKSGIPVEVLCDGASGYWFGRGEITLSVVGADRIAANGDVANKIGTYTVACLSLLHARPFYVAAPWSTVDLACEKGARIPIEFRAASEITDVPFADAPPAEEASRAGEGRPRRWVPEGVGVLNPAFDVTPAAYVTRIFTERGVFAPTELRSGGGSA